MGIRSHGSLLYRLEVTKVQSVGNLVCDLELIPGAKALLKLLFEFPQSAEASLDVIGIPDFVLVVTIVRGLHNGHTVERRFQTFDYGEPLNSSQFAKRVERELRRRKKGGK